MLWWTSWSTHAVDKLLAPKCGGDAMLLARTLVVEEVEAFFPSRLTGYAPSGPVVVH